MDKLCNLLNILKEKGLDKTYHNALKDIFDLRDTLLNVKEEVDNAILTLVSEGKYSDIAKLTTIPAECEKVVNLLNDVLEGNIENITIDIVSDIEGKPEELKPIVDMDKGYNLYTDSNFFTSTKPYKIVIYGDEYTVNNWRATAQILFKYLYNLDRSIFMGLREVKEGRYFGQKDKVVMRKAIEIDKNFVFEGYRDTCRLVSCMASISKQYSSAMDKDIRENVQIYITDIS